MTAGGKRWGAFALLAVLIVGAVYLFRSDIPLPEIAEVAGEGGEKLLREPLRAPGGAPRVLVLALDGVGADELHAALSSGRMPRLAALTGPPADEPGLFAHAFSAPGVLSILPSTTFAAWASVFTGEPAGHTGIPGNEWFVREQARFYAPAPVSVTGTKHAAQVYSDDLVGGVLGVPTVYELADVRSHVSLSAVHRGADLLTTPDLSAIDELAAASVEGLAGEDEVERSVYAELDRTANESLIETLRKRGVPELQVVYFPGVDLYTHVATPPLTEQAQYLAEVVDPAIGRIFEEYQRQGTLDETYVLIVSDHGHTPVLNDDLHALGTEGADEPIEVLRQAGFRVRPFKLELDEDEQDFQAVVAYQGAIAYVYLADRSTCPGEGQRCDWTRPPRLREDVLPVASAFYRASTAGAGVPQMRGALDMVFARAPTTPGGDAVPFQVFDGEGLVPVGEYLERSPRPDLLDLERRLEGLATGPYGDRAGDVLLLARTGVDRPIEDRYYFSGQYHSWHGSPTAQDSRIPLLVGRRGDAGTEIRERVETVLGAEPSQLDITPLILSLLGRSQGR